MRVVKQIKLKNKQIKKKTKSRNGQVKEEIRVCCQKKTKTKKGNNENWNEKKTETKTTWQSWLTMFASRRPAWDSWRWRYVHWRLRRSRTDRSASVRPRGSTLTTRTSGTSPGHWRSPSSGRNSDTANSHQRATHPDRSNLTRNHLSPQHQLTLHRNSLKVVFLHVSSKQNFKICKNSWILKTSKIRKIEILNLCLTFLIRFCFFRVVGLSMLKRIQKQAGMRVDTIYVLDNIYVSDRNERNWN